MTLQEQSKRTIGFIGMGHMRSYMAHTDEADEILVSMPASAVALQMYTTALMQGMDEDSPIMIKFMEQLAGVSGEEHLSIH